MSNWNPVRLCHQKTNELSIESTEKKQREKEMKEKNKQQQQQQQLSRTVSITMESK